MGSILLRREPIKRCMCGMPPMATCSTPIRAIRIPSIALPGRRIVSVLLQRVTIKRYRCGMRRMAIFLSLIPVIRRGCGSSHGRRMEHILLLPEAIKLCVCGVPVMLRLSIPIMDIEASSQLWLGLLIANVWFQLAAMVLHRCGMLAMVLIYSLIDWLPQPYGRQPGLLMGNVSR